MKSEKWNLHEPEQIEKHSKNALLIRICEYGERLTTH